MQIGTTAKNKVCSVLWLVMAAVGVIGNGLCAKPPEQANAAAHDVRWEYVPLRTVEQKAKGYAGGEMGQMAFSIATSTSPRTHVICGSRTL
jgi:hypothetical protein